MQRKPDSNLVRLSRREAQILGLVMQGQSNKAIAAALEISAHTVKQYVGGLCHALALPGKFDLGLWGLMHPHAAAGDWCQNQTHHRACRCDLCAAVRKAIPPAA